MVWWVYLMKNLVVDEEDELMKLKSTVPQRHRLTRNMRQQNLDQFLQVEQRLEGEPSDAAGRSQRYLV
jgi:hypothetical protein